jgi:hypothetical protein
VGIDDWAFRKGRSYGTIIVDLEHHRVIDLLPDQEQETVFHWLEQHPEIAVVTRDRSTDYTTAIQMGAPQALAVAERWHLLFNLRQMLERWLASFIAASHHLKSPQNKLICFLYNNIPSGAHSMSGWSHVPTAKGGSHDITSFNSFGVRGAAS